MAKISKNNSENLSKIFAERRSHTYPAHEWLAEKFPDYVKIMLDLDYEIRQKTKLFDEKMHELFHIIALAVKGSNPHNQQHLKAHIKKGIMLGLDPEEIAEALMVCVNPGGAMVLTYSITCMLEALDELNADGWKKSE
jgi:alkylhydroperoxidase/carboxymuconolactone decarboxylase family protein YurZ